MYQEMVCLYILTRPIKTFLRSYCVLSKNTLLFIPNPLFACQEKNTFFKLHLAGLDEKQDLCSKKVHSVYYNVISLVLNRIF